MLHGNETRVTVHNKRSKIPTVNLNARELVCEDSALLTFHYASSSTQNASEQFVPCILLSFVNFALPTIPQTKNLTEVDLEIQTALSRYHMNFILTMTNTIISKILTFPRESPSI